MSKSIVVFKTPKNCDECQLCVAVLGKRYCPAKGTEISKGERDCSCPAVAVPSPMDPDKARGAYDVGCIKGYNDCLSKITGESYERNDKRTWGNNT